MASQKTLESICDNYINGNIEEAKQKAKRVDGLSIAFKLCEWYGFSENKAYAVASFLKNRGVTWQEACDAN